MLSRANYDAGVEFLGTADRTSLDVLILKWLEADASRIEVFGVDPGPTAEQAIEALFSDRYTDVIRPAKNLIEIFEDATDPIGQEIVELLRRVAGVECIPENGGGAGVRLRKLSGREGP